MAINVLNNQSLQFGVMAKTLPTKGRLVYEYNPFRNYRLNSPKYLYKGKFYDKEKLKIDTGIDLENYIKLPDDIELYEKGLLIDFVTDELSFSLDHPVHIIPQSSYDGSVNLIINDGINTPRLINSRFSPTGKNTYEIVDRKGNNDTNIYDEGELFDIDTSLYKLVNKIPKLEFLGVQGGGNLKVGNYHFYFKLADADGNETDFVAESGLVSVFIGFNTPHSISTGLKNLNSVKLVKFKLHNIDSAYSYVYVYYSRSTAEGDENSITEYVKIDKRYVINNMQTAYIVITGFENTDNISASDLNLHYNIVDAVGTSATCLNMLFMANVHKPDLPYKDLTDLALRFLPYLKLTTYTLDMTEDYSITSTNKGYYDPLFIYSTTGYWGNELYRFGIVFMMSNGELTPVFNIRGREGVAEYDENNELYHLYKLRDAKDNRVYIKSREDTNYIMIPDLTEGTPCNNAGAFENNKGVLSFSSSLDTNKIYALNIKVDYDVVEELKKLGVKGYFFVRQKRLPMVLALGITIGVDKNAHTPTIPTASGFLDDIGDSLDGATHVETNDIFGLNYISEGFLLRYTFKLSKKKSFWGSIGKIVAITAVITAGVGAALFTGGSSLIASAAVLTGLATAGTTVVSATTAALTIGIATAVAGAAGGVIAATAATVDEAIKFVQRSKGTKKLNGRYTKIEPGFVKEEKDDSRKVGGDFLNRIIIKDSESNSVEAILCPDFEVNQPYYNLLFTGNIHTVRTTKSQGVNVKTGYKKNDGANATSYNYFTNKNRHFYIPSYSDEKTLYYYECKILSVPDNTKLIGIEDKKFRSRAGEAEEAWRYEQIGKEWEGSEDIKINSDIIRGAFGPYLAMTDFPDSPATTVEIMIPGYNISNLGDYILVRMDDKSSYSAISDRIDILDLNNYLQDKSVILLLEDVNKSGYLYELYRGDCYLCLVTHRLNRNFNDPSAPYNDEIVDDSTWRENYDPDKTEKYAEINLGDVNAVEMGMWVTFRIRSSYNLNIRTLDGSFVDEEAMIGHPRGYYPALPMSTEGNYKVPESADYNRGFATSVSERWNFELPDVPHIKNWFKTRIMYSDIHINDAYKNGYRVFRGTHYRDYTREYGEIIKLVPFESNLLCVFEHGIALIPVNERAVAGEGAGGNVYINTSNVLPENPKIISDMFGSQWAESVLKVPGLTGDSRQYVYGVDTVAKKIWRTDGNILQCISDFKVQEFLNNNITLGERETIPRIGIRNVKTVYNAYKRDVMFTFYDNTYGFEEKVWNLCWNELLEKFITFYSWVPSHMENINNTPFSFNRNTAKYIAKLAASHEGSSISEGITLKDNIIPNDSFNWRTTLNFNEKLLPIDKEKVLYKITYSLVNDLFDNYKYFDSEKVKNGILLLIGSPRLLMSELYYRNNKGHLYSDDVENRIAYTDLNNANLNLPIYKDLSGKRPTLPRLLMIRPDKIVVLLNIKANIEIVGNNESDLSDTYYNLKAGLNKNTSLIDVGQYETTVAVIPQWNMLFLTTDFWKHGQATTIDITDPILPTYWYGIQHPFEFECVVVNDPSVHKIFTNLELVANKAKPESFHYEVIGENYDFAKDKPNMYFRQEAMKALWLYNGVDITYNRDFLKVLTNLQPKSADLPHVYYSRLDTINEIEDYYPHVSFNNKTGLYDVSHDYDYRHLSGAEIVYYPTRQEFRIWNHALAVSMDDLPLDTARSVIAANCRYLEGKWDITINPIIVCYKNEYTSYTRENNYGVLLINYKESESNWADTTLGKRPKFAIYNSPIPSEIVEKGTIKYPEGKLAKHNGELSVELAKNFDTNIEDEENALYNLYTSTNIYDTENWLNSDDIYVGGFGEALNRREVDIRDKFMKVRIRYTGDELAIIDFLNTIYRVSYA